MLAELDDRQLKEELGAFSVVKCKSPLNVPKGTYDHSCY
jgi:hypothetical protein